MIGKNMDLKQEDLLCEIEKIIDSGTKLNIDYHIDQILDPDQQEEIFDYFMKAESESLGAALKELGTDEYTEEEIRYVRVQFMSKVAL